MSEQVRRGRYQRAMHFADRVDRDGEPAGRSICQAFPVTGPDRCAATTDDSLVTCRACLDRMGIVDIPGFEGTLETLSDLTIRGTK